MGGGGGGGAMRTFPRAIRAGVGSASPNTTTPVGASKTAGKAKNLNKNKKQPISPALTLNSSMLNVPMSASSAAPAWISSPSSTIFSDEFESEWEYVDDETAPLGLYDDYVFGTVPSSDEVRRAVSALQKALATCSKSSTNAKLDDITNKDVAVNSKHFEDDQMISLSTDSETDWLELSPSLHSSKMLQKPGSDMVYDAFHLLETEPSVQKMVVSLSSDKAVWEAVLKNDAVKELRGSIDRVSSIVKERSNKAADVASGDESILGWIVLFAKGKMMQLLDLITKLMNNVFVAPNQDKEGDAMDGKVRSSFFLSLVVLLVVILARTKNKNASRTKNKNA